MGALLALTFAAAPMAAQSRVVLPAGSVILVRTTTPLQSASAQDRTDVRDDGERGGRCG
jgi:hypothetical protein